MNSKIFITSIIVFSLFLFGCSVNTEFKQKQKCHQYLEAYSNKISSSNAIINDPVVFYSPKQNTCLGAYISSMIDENYRSHTYIIDDILSNENIYYEIFESNNTEGQTNEIMLKEFQDKILELKN